MACLTTFPVIITSILLEHLYPANEWGSVEFIAGLLAFGFGSIIWLPRIYARLPCPNCDQTNLTQERSKDLEKWHLLLCENCKVEWQIGIGDNTD